MLSEDEYSDVNSQSISSRDRLDYRQTIRRIAEALLNAKEPGTIKYRAEVLKKGLYFDIPGLFFRSKIDRFAEKVNVDMESYKKELLDFISSRGSIYYKPETMKDLCFQDIPTYRLNMTLHEWGELWTPFLIGLLAEVEALFKTKGAVEKGSEIGKKMREVQEKMEHFI
jgi:hypothetical protein